MPERRRPVSASTPTRREPMDLGPEPESDTEPIDDDPGRTRTRSDLQDLSLSRPIIADDVAHEPVQPVEENAPVEVDDYDAIYGHTVARSVQGAAVHSADPSNDESLGIVGETRNLPKPDASPVVGSSAPSSPPPWQSAPPPAPMIAGAVAFFVNTFGHHLLSFNVERIGAVLGAHLHNLAGFLRGRDQIGSFFDSVRQRLFNVDVLTGGQRR